MRYVFLNSIDMRLSTGGPRSYALNNETMLKRHADFPFKIDTDVVYFFRGVKPDDIVQIHSHNFGSVKKAMDRKLRIIIGPNHIWERAPKSVFSYPRVVAAMRLPGSGFKLKRRVTWKDKIIISPLFADEKFFKPWEQKKDIDVLTANKAFNYGPFKQEYAKLQKILKEMKIRHVHLKNYKWKDFRDHLNRTKLFLFPSPKETGLSICHALIEANLMNVPFIGLEQTIQPKSKLFDPCRGIAAKDVRQMTELIKPALDNLDCFSPREWGLKHFSCRSAYEQLKEILKGA